jgi:hypothetical protein
MFEELHSTFTEGTAAISASLSASLAPLASLEGRISELVRDYNTNRLQVYWSTRKLEN